MTTNDTPASPAAQAPTRSAAAERFARYIAARLPPLAPPPAFTPPAAPQETSQ